MHAPIVLFVYNRPNHTRKTLESLEENLLSKESDLYIYSDGPKKDASKEEVEKIKKTRDIIRQRKWCEKVTIIEKKENMGLANSITTGVTEIVNKYGKIIVLEDDLILSTHFLEYMNNALDRYKIDDRVMQISGHMFPAEIHIEEDALFLPFTSSWGWATWKRSWKLFDWDSKGLDILRENPLMRKRFNLDNSYPFYDMLLKQKSGRVDSWAIKFYLIVFLNNGLVLYPKKTLVWNGGFDKDAVHTKIGMLQSKIDDTFKILEFPKQIAIDKDGESKIFSFIKRQNNIFARAFRVIFRKTI
jgi:hypothetical protein